MPVNMPIPFEKSNSKNNVINITPSITYEDVPISKDVLTALKTDVDWPMSASYIPLNSMILDGDVIYYIKQDFKYVKYDIKSGVKTQLTIAGYTSPSVRYDYIYKYAGDGKLYHMYSTGWNGSGGYTFILYLIDLKKLQYTKCFQTVFNCDGEYLNYFRSSYTYNRFFLNDEIIFVIQDRSFKYKLTKVSFTGVQTQICDITNYGNFNNITSVYKENGSYYMMCSSDRNLRSYNDFYLYKCTSSCTLIKNIKINVGTSDYDGDPYVIFNLDYVVESSDRKKILLWPATADNGNNNTWSPYKANSLLYIEINESSTDFKVEIIPFKTSDTRVFSDKPVVFTQSADFSQKPTELSDKFHTASLITENDTASNTQHPFHMHPTFFDWNDTSALYYIFGFRYVSESGSEYNNGSTDCYTKFELKLPLMRKFISK